MRTFLVAVMALLVLAPTAGAATMTLQSATIDGRNWIDKAHWTASEAGASGSASWNTDGTTRTYSWSVPATITASGGTATLSIAAQSRKNMFDQHTRASPPMSVYGDVVTPGGSVVAAANADSATKPDDAATATATLVARAGTAIVQVGLQDGPTYVYTYVAQPDPPVVCAARVAQQCPAPQPAPCAKLSGITRNVKVSRAEGAFVPAVEGECIGKGDRVHTSFKAGVTLTLPDGSTMDVAQMSMIQIDEITYDGGRLRGRMWLRLGTVTSHINRSMGAASDFQVQTPTTVAAVRGTRFTVAYDGVATTVAVTESSVDVTAKKSGASVTVLAGQESRSTATSVSAPAKLGTSGRRGGLTAAKALARLTSALSKPLAKCKSTSCRRSSAVRARPGRAAS